MKNTQTDDEGAFDLTDVLKNRMLALSFDYVLIVEWLFDEDERTGGSLARWLLGKLPPERVVYVECSSPDELESALLRALDDIPTRGTPIVHIEAHGEDPVAGQTPGGFVGPDGEGGRELLAWDWLANALRPLNIASGLNLLVVGAACYGEGLMLGAEGGEQMPFVAVVGYTEKVLWQSLRDSLLELYRCLLLDRMELGLAVEEANRQLHRPDDADLRLTSMVVQLAESFIEGTARSIQNLKARFPLEPSKGQDYVDRSGLATLSPTALNLLRRGLEQAWNVTWLLQGNPKNVERFSIDQDRLIELAIEYADREPV